MRILIDIGHPAHVHLFKNFARIMKEKGNKVIITTKDDKIIKYLLDKENLRYINLGKKGTGLKGKFLKQILFDLKVLYYLYKHNIQIAMGTSISISHACLFHRSKSIIFNEDNIRSAPLFAKLTYPFADRIVTPESLGEYYGKEHIRVKSLHELAYLHPDNFKSDKRILKELGMKNGEDYFILRFNAFKAHHDVGMGGLNNKTKIKLVNLLRKHGKVFITSEENIGKELKEYQIKIPPERMHHALKYARLFIGDSQTMTLETAVLGTPSIRCNDFVGKCPVIEEIEHKYGLTYGFKPKNIEKMFTKIKELLIEKNLKQKSEKKRNILLKNKINLTKWMVNFIEKETK